MTRWDKLLIGAATLLAGVVCLDAAFGLPISNYAKIAIVGVVDSIATAVIPEGEGGVINMTPYGAMKVALFNSSGEEITSLFPSEMVVPAGHYTETNFRCDNSGSLAGTSGPIGGVTCASGTWFAAVDARGAVLAGLTVIEYGDGSGAWSLWDCIDPPGSDGTLAGVSPPGVEDPASAPTPADPDPLCTKINLDPDGAEVVLNGVLPRELHFSDRTFHYLIIRTDTCTGNCDATLQLQVRF